MSNPEIEPDDSRVVRFDDVQSQLTQFVVDAEVDTVFDYQAGGKRLIRNKLSGLLEKHPFANNPLCIAPVADVSRTIDFSTGQEEIHRGPILGYLAKFYPVADVANLAEMTAADFETGGDSLTDPWLFPHNPVSIHLGLRMRPLFVPNGYNPEHTYIEVPVSQIKTAFEVLPEHPLQIEQEIFNYESQRLLGLDVPAETYEKLLNGIVQTQTEECQFANCEVCMELLPNSTVFAAPDLRDVRVCVANGDIANLPLVELPNSGFKKMRIKGFDWLWTGLESVWSSNATTDLYAVVELLEADDVHTAGMSTVCIPVDAFRFGVYQEHRSRITQPTNVFAYEHMIFEQSIGHFAAQQHAVAQEQAEDAVNSVLKMLNTMSGMFPHQKVDPAESRTLSATVCINLTEDSTVDAIDYDGEEIGLDIPEEQDVEGVVQMFQAVQTEDEDGTVFVELVVNLNVTQDRYMRVRGIQSVRVPVERIGRAQIITNVLSSYQDEQYPNLAGYIHAN